MNNPIANKYQIDRSNPEYIIVKSETDEFQLQQAHETFNVTDCIITRFEEYNNPATPEYKFIQYTDINGISSEVLLEQKDFDEYSIDVSLNEDYCVLALNKFDAPDDVFYAYITLTQTEQEQ